MAATVQAFSAGLGQGSEFVVLPAEGMKAGGNRVTAFASTLFRLRFKGELGILVVDDYPSRGRKPRHVAGTKGHQVWIAHDGSVGN